MSDRIGSVNLKYTTGTNELLRLADAGDAKLRAEKGANGITLFTTNRETGADAVVGGMFGIFTHPSKQRTLAREALTTWLKGQFIDQPVSPQAKAALKQFISKGELTGKSLRDFIRTIEPLLPGNALAGAYGDVSYRPPSSSFDPALFQQGPQGSGQSPDVVIHRYSGAPSSTPEELPLPNLGAPLQGAQGQAVQGQGAQVQGAPLQPQIQSVLVQPQMQPQAQGPDSQATMTGAGRMNLGGDQYARGQELGKGGFGTVSLFHGPNGRTIAVKEANAGRSVQETQREFDAHRNAIGDGTNVSHLVPLRGKVMNGSGEIVGVMTDHMAGGSGSEMLRKIRQAETSGRISAPDAEAARLTLLKDMATGLSQLHDNRGMTHRDLKPGNYLVGGDGVARLSDFGSVAPEGEQRGERLAKMPGTTVYTAPEAILAERDVSALMRQARRLQGQNQALAQTANVLGNKIGGDAGSALVDRMNAIQVGREADVFSLGLSAARVVHNTQLSGDSDQVKEKIKLLGMPDSSRRNAVLRELGLMADTPENILIRSMLERRPEDRLTASEVMNTPPLDDPRVGGTRARNVLSGLAQGTL